MSVHPSVCPAMRFVILHPFDLGKVPKDAEFNEVLHEPLKFSVIFLESSGDPNLPQIFRN